MNELEVKAAVRERDGNRCVECAMTSEEHIEEYGSTLEVHRLKPGLAYTVDGCVTLCKACHGGKPKSAIGTGAILHVKLSPELRQAFDRLRRNEKRNRQNQLEIVIEEYLFNYGLWPEQPIRPQAASIAKQSPLAASLLGLQPPP